MNIKFSHAKRKNKTNKIATIIFKETESENYEILHILIAELNKELNLDSFYKFSYNFTLDNATQTNFIGDVYFAPLNLKKDILTTIDIIPHTALFQINFNYKLLEEKIVGKLKSCLKPYFIYILRCDNNSLYTGIATDYAKRFKEHIEKKGAKYTKNRKVLSIEKVWKTEGRSNASKIEYTIKQLSKNQKENLIKNPLFLSEYINIVFSVVN